MVWHIQAVASSRAGSSKASISEVRTSVIEISAFSLFGFISVPRVTLRGDECRGPVFDLGFHDQLDSFKIAIWLFFAQGPFLVMGHRIGVVLQR